MILNILITDIGFIFKYGKHIGVKRAIAFKVTHNTLYMLLSAVSASKIYSVITGDTLHLRATDLMSPEPQ